LAEVERVPQRSTQKIAEAVGLGSHETYRKANKKGRKKNAPAAARARAGAEGLEQAY